MLDKVKVLKIALYFPGATYMDDQQLCTLTGLNVADLDENFYLAETCYTKAYSKRPSQQPATRYIFDVSEAWIEEVKYWVEYYFREENCERTS
jgi:hypothetical protein